MNITISKARAGLITLGVVVIAMPDGFNNLATKCDHGNRIYVSFHSNGAYGFGMVVPADPTCKGK